MNRKLMLVIAVAAAFQGPRPAMAQDGQAEFWSFMAEEARNLTVASAAPETVFNSVSNITVIDREMIERYNFPSVSDALQTLPGVMVVRTSLAHNIPTIRGALQENYADKVLVMIDNVPMWSAVLGEADLDRVGIGSVERIEVLRGPASVLYGSNALSGAINIVLRKPAGKNSGLGAVVGGLGTAAGGYAGNLDVSSAGGFYSWNGDGVSYTLAADSYNRAQPAFRFTNEAGAVNSVKDYLNARSINFSGSYGHSAVLLNAYRSDQNSLGNSLTLDTGELFNIDKEAALAAYSYDFAPGWGRLKYTTTYDWQRRNNPRDIYNKMRADIVGSRFVNTLGGRADLPRNFYAEAGAAHEYRYTRHCLFYDNHTGMALSDNGMNDRASQESSAHIQFGYDGETWKLLTGSRFTHDTGAGDNLSYRASAIYMFSERNSVKAMFSRSFRAPTPFEQYFPSTSTVMGNPGLKPERADTFELSYLAARGRFYGQLTVYYAGYRDAVFRNLGTFVRDGIAYGNVNFYANAPEYNSKGAELEVRYEHKLTHAFVSAEYLHGSRGDEHAVAGGDTWNFKYVPSYRISCGLSRDMGDFFASSSFNAYGRNRTLRGHIDSQIWGDAGAGYKKGNTRHTLAVRNITGRAVMFPEYVRLRVVEAVPLYTGRRVEYTFEYRF